MSERTGADKWREAVEAKAANYAAGINSSLLTETWPLPVATWRTRLRARLWNLRWRLAAWIVNEHPDDLRWPEGEPRSDLSFAEMMENLLAFRD